MHVPERVYGTENEYGVLLQTANGAIDTVVDGLALLHFYHGIKAQNPPALFTGGRAWSANGSSTYIDSAGEHPEHATAEARSIRDAVCCNKAGELLITGLFGSLLPDSSSLLLFKNNLGVNEDGTVEGEYGCHENYYAPRIDIARSGPIHTLIPFLISRQIMDGAGWWQRDGTYRYSQRAMGISTDISPTTTGKRGIITTRATKDTGLNSRLQIIMGDSNILEFAIYLKLGITSLVLSLIESGIAPVPVCRAPVIALHAICRSCDPHAKHIRLGTGDNRSALEVQTDYFESCRRHLRDASFDSETTEAESRHILVLWEQALHAISGNDEEWMIGRFDYATKKYLAERHIQRKHIPPSEIQSIKKDIDIWYHQVNSRTLQDRMNQWWPDRRIVTDEEIRTACNEPPPDTRARLRGRFVQLALQGNPWNVMHSPYVDWTRISYRRGALMHALDFENPLMFDFKAADSFFTELEEYIRDT
ncbi:MAG: proteasome accessory factor PafA2 family protein [bacterium]|nr:proteasome accessory factor PafA2 family protein [bacterium]